MTPESPRQPESKKTPGSLGRKTRAGVMWTYVRSYGLEIVTLPATIILARLLTPFDFGVAGITIFFGRLAARLSNAGMGVSLIGVKELRDEHVSSVFVANLVLTAVSAAALLLAAPSIARFYRTPVVESLIWVVTLDFVFSALSMVSQALLSRNMRYKDMAMLSALDTAAVTVGTVVLAWYGFQYWSIVLGALCGSAVRWLWGVRLVGWQVSFRFVPSAARELMSLALGSYMKMLLDYSSQNVDNLVIGRVLGVTELGIYDKAFSSVQRAYNKLTVSGPMVSFRALVVIQDEPERFRRALEKIVVTATLVSYSALAVLGAMGPHLITLLFGDNWRGAIVPFQLLCASGALKAANAFGNAAAVARGSIWPNLWRQGVQVVVMVVGIYLAAPWGINGAAGAVLGSTALMFVMIQTVLSAATGLRLAELVRHHVPGLLLAAFLGSLVWGLDVALGASGLTSDFLILAVQGAAGAIAGLAALRWTPFPIVAVVVHELVGDYSARLAALLAPGRREAATTK